MTTPEGIDALHLALTLACGHLNNGKRQVAHDVIRQALVDHADRAQAAKEVAGPPPTPEGIEALAGAIYDADPGQYADGSVIPWGDLDGVKANTHARHVALLQAQAAMAWFKAAASTTAQTVKQVAAPPTPEVTDAMVAAANQAYVRCYKPSNGRTSGEIAMHAAITAALAASGAGQSCPPPTPEGIADREALAKLVDKASPCRHCDALDIADVILAAGFRRAPTPSRPEKE